MVNMIHIDNTEVWWYDVLVFHFGTLLPPQMIGESEMSKVKLLEEMYMARRSLIRCVRSRDINKRRTVATALTGAVEHINEAINSLTEVGDTHGCRKPANSRA